jgi:hypothetical protein
MLSLKGFIQETTDKDKIPWHKSEDNKHWSDHDHLVVYHGTHVKNVPKILSSGLDKPDPKTGMISVAIGNHGSDVAHGYAAMSGESAFRKAGAKAIQVPPEDRAVVMAHLPREWVDAHVDRSFGGNSESVKRRLSSRNMHTMFTVKNGKAFHAHETPELRFTKPIPAKYIKGWMQKGTAK